MVVLVSAIVLGCLVKIRIVRISVNISSAQWKGVITDVLFMWAVTITTVQFVMFMLT